MRYCQARRVITNSKNELAHIAAQTRNEFLSGLSWCQGRSRWEAGIPALYLHPRILEGHSCFLNPEKLRSTIDSLTLDSDYSNNSNTEMADEQ